MNLTGELSNTAPSCLGLAAYVLRAHLYIADIQAIYKLAILYHYIKYMSIIYTVIGSISCIYGFYISIRHILYINKKATMKAAFLSFSNLLNTADTDHPMLRDRGCFQAP